jgi:hypothetical protein
MKFDKTMLMWIAVGLLLEHYVGILKRIGL